jgi:hypothetical protein
MIGPLTPARPFMTGPLTPARPFMIPEGSSQMEQTILRDHGT